VEGEVCLDLVTLRNSALSSTPQVTSALVMSFMDSGGENIRVVRIRSM